MSAPKHVLGVVGLVGVALLLGPCGRLAEPHEHQVGHVGFRMHFLGDFWTTSDAQVLPLLVVGSRGCWNLYWLIGFWMSGLKICSDFRRGKHQALSDPTPVFWESDGFIS